MSLTTNITMFQGEARAINDSLVDPVTNNPLDVTGWTMRFTMRGNPASVAPVEVMKDNVGGGGLTITDAVNGKVQITLAKADTQSLPVGLHYYDVRRIDSGSEADLSDGIICLKQAVITLP